MFFAHHLSSEEKEQEKEAEAEDKQAMDEVFSVDESKINDHNRALLGIYKEECFKLIQSVRSACNCNGKFTFFDWIRLNKGLEYQPNNTERSKYKTLPFRFAGKRQTFGLTFTSKNTDYFIIVVREKNTNKFEPFQGLAHKISYSYVERKKKEEELKKKKKESKFEKKFTVLVLVLITLVVIIFCSNSKKNM